MENHRPSFSKPASAEEDGDAAFDQVVGTVSHDHVVAHLEAKTDPLLQPVIRSAPHKKTVADPVAKEQCVSSGDQGNRFLVGEVIAPIETTAMSVSKRAYSTRLAPTSSLKRL